MPTRRSFAKLALAASAAAALTLAPLASAQAQENFSGARLVRAFAQEEAQIAAFETSNREYIRRGLRLVQLMGMLWPTLEFVLGLAMAITLLVGDRLVALTGRSRENQTLAAFDLETGRAVWSVGVKQVGQGLLLSAGDAVVAILSPLVPSFTGRNHVNQPPEYQILRVDAAQGGDVVRITPRGLGAYPPSAVIQDGALLIAGQRAWALYR